MAEIVVPHNVPQRIHEAFKTAVYQGAHTGDVVCANLTCGQVPLFAVRTVKYHVQVDKIESLERTIGTRLAEMLKLGIETLDLSFEDHDTAWREEVRNNDFGERTLIVEALGNENRRHLDKLAVDTTKMRLRVAGLV